MTATGNKVCNICNLETTGEYCPQCGQRITGKRLYFNSFAKDLVFNLFDLERTGLGTILLLIKNPFKVIGNYWEGNRKYYDAPGKLIVYALLVIGIHIIIHDNLIFGLSFDINGIAPQALFLLIFLSFLTLSSYLTYIRQKRTILEHVVATIYLFGCWVIIIIILNDVFIYLTKTDINLISFLVFMALIFIWTARTFCKRPGWAIIALSAVAQLVVLMAQYTCRCRLL